MESAADSQFGHNVTVVDAGSWSWKLDGHLSKTHQDCTTYTYASKCTLSLLHMCISDEGWILLYVRRLQVLEVWKRCSSVLQWFISSLDCAYSVSCCIFVTCLECEIDGNVCSNAVTDWRLLLFSYKFSVSSFASYLAYIYIVQPSRSVVFFVAYMQHL